MSPLLKIDRLKFAYDSKPLIKDINFSISNLEFVGLIGPNGSGKSTLLKLMGGILKCDQGQIDFKGNPINSIHKKELAQSLTWIPQDHPMVFPFTVQEIVMMGRHPYLTPLSFEADDDLQIVQEAMERTQTLQFSERYFNEISGGEKQRVMLASAIAQKPEIMLLDEPTSALDLKYQIQILNILKCLNEQNKITIVMALHDLNLASRYCQRLILLQDGDIVSDGAPNDVLQKEIIEKVYGVEVELQNHNGGILVHPVKEL
ncbi:MAG: heme ABC transporter ATP-binding protein [Nitrospinota bacterium]